MGVCSTDARGDWEVIRRESIYNKKSGKAEDLSLIAPAATLGMKKLDGEVG